MKQKTSFQKHLEKVRAQVKDKNITHEEACILVSCDYGIDQLKSICKCFLLDFEELSGVYRVIEKIYYKLGKSVGAKIKCGLAIDLKYNLTKAKIALLSEATPSTLAIHRWEIKPYVIPHLERSPKLEYNPDFSQNPDLFFLLTYLKKEYGFFYKGSLSEILFSLFRARPVELPFESVLQESVRLIKEKTSLSKKKEVILAEEAQKALEKLLIGLSVVKVGTITISSGEVYITEPRYMANQDFTIAAWRFTGSPVYKSWISQVRKGRWIVEVERSSRSPIEVLRIIHTSLYKDNGAYNWEEKEKKLINPNSTKICVIDASVFLQKKKDKELFLREIDQLFSPGLYYKSGVVCQMPYRARVVELVEIKEKGKVIALRLKFLRSRK